MVGKRKRASPWIPVYIHGVRELKLPDRELQVQKVRVGPRVMVPRGGVTTLAPLTRYRRVDNRMYFTFPVCEESGSTKTLHCSQPLRLSMTPLHFRRLGVSELAIQRMRNELSDAVFFIFTIPWGVECVLSCPFAVFLYPA